MDYDLGRDGYAYEDRLSQDIHDEQGQWKVWNEGRRYRNDGVDIGGFDGQYYVSWTEVGEWLQYTIFTDIDTISDLVFMASGNSGVISIDVNEKNGITRLELKESKEWVNYKFKNLYLPKGQNRIRFRIEEGGIDLKAFKLIAK